MDGINLKDVWRYVKVDSGGPSVIVSGTRERQELYVGNLDSLET